MSLTSWASHTVQAGFASLLSQTSKLGRAEVLWLSKNNLKTINEPEMLKLLEQQIHNIQRLKTGREKVGDLLALPDHGPGAILLIHLPGNQSAPTLVSRVTGYLILCSNNFVPHCWFCCCSIEVVPPRNQPRRVILFPVFWFSCSSVNSSASWLSTCADAGLNPLLPAHGRGSGLSRQARFYWPRTRSTSCHAGAGGGELGPFVAMQIKTFCLGCFHGKATHGCTEKQNSGTRLLCRSIKVQWLYTHFVTHLFWTTKALEWLWQEQTCTCIITCSTVSYSYSETHTHTKDRTGDLLWKKVTDFNYDSQERTRLGSDSLKNLHVQVASYESEGWNSRALLFDSPAPPSLHSSGGALWIRV